MRFYFDFLSHRLGAVLELKRISNIEVVGYSNRCQDGKYIIFLDYDSEKLDRSWIIEELRAIMRDFYLSEFYILQTEHGYHAVCFDKLSLQGLIEILNYSSCDYNFKSVPLKYGRLVWNLRFTAKHRKPFIVQVIKNPVLIIREKSKAHIDIFEQRFKRKVNRQNQDNISTLCLCKYNS